MRSISPNSAVRHQISVGAVRHQIWVEENNGVDFVTSRTGRNMSHSGVFYPYNIPNGISACAVLHLIWVGAVRHQIWVDIFNNTLVSSHTGRDIFPDASFYPYTIPNGIIARAIWHQTRVGNFWKSQIVTLNKGRGHNVKYLPYAFTEQGVAMLSAVLRSDVAVQVSIQIMQAFVSMRKFLLNNASVFQRLDQVEMKQLKTDEKIEQIFKALEAGQPKPDKGIFFDGQVFDAYVFVAELIKKAKTDIILIDNYVDESVLMLLSKRDKKSSATIYTKSISKTLELDIEKHNSQYTTIAIKELTASHDRFLIIDHNELYHIGASLKDLGKKWFAFSKMEKSMTNMILEQINKERLV